MPHVAHTRCGSRPTQFHLLDAIPETTSKPFCPAQEFLLYISIYIYIEIAIAVTDGFAATQATAEHATNCVAALVANKTKNEGSKQQKQKKVNDFLHSVARFSQRVFNAVCKAISLHLIFLYFTCAYVA